VRIDIIFALGRTAGRTRSARVPARRKSRPVAHRHTVAAPDEEWVSRKRCSLRPICAVPRDDRPRRTLDLGMLMRFAASSSRDSAGRSAPARAPEAHCLGSHSPIPHDVDLPLRPFARLLDGDVFDARPPRNAGWRRRRLRSRQGALSSARFWRSQLHRCGTLATEGEYFTSRSPVVALLRPGR